MNQIKISSRVYQLLTEDEKTRDDDWYLIGRYLEKQSRVDGVAGIYLMKHSKDFNLPSPESISRARRKIQEEHPELKGTKVEIRAKEEEKYREWAREWKQASLKK